MSETKTEDVKKPKQVIHISMSVRVYDDSYKFTEDMNKYRARKNEVDERGVSDDSHSDSGESMNSDYLGGVYSDDEGSGDEYN